MSHAKLECTHCGYSGDGLEDQPNCPECGSQWHSSHDGKLSPLHIHLMWLILLLTTVPILIQAGWMLLVSSIDRKTLSGYIGIKGADITSMAVSEFKTICALVAIICVLILSSTKAIYAARIKCIFLGLYAFAALLLSFIV